MLDRSETHRPADDAGITREARLPRLVSEHDDVRRVRALVGFNERAVEERRYPNEPKRRGAELGHVDRRAPSLAGDEIALHGPECTQLANGPELLAPRDEVVHHLRRDPTRGRIPVLDAH